MSRSSKGARSRVRRRRRRRGGVCEEEVKKSTKGVRSRVRHRRRRRGGVGEEEGAVTFHLAATIIPSGSGGHTGRRNEVFISRGVWGIFKLIRHSGRTRCYFRYEYVCVTRTVSSSFPPLVWLSPSRGGETVSSLGGWQRVLGVKCTIPVSPAEVG